MPLPFSTSPASFTVLPPPRLIAANFGDFLSPPNKIKFSKLILCFFSSVFFLFSLKEELFFNRKKGNSFAPKTPKLLQHQLSLCFHADNEKKKCLKTLLLNLISFENVVVFFFPYLQFIKSGSKVMAELLASCLEC